MQFQWEIKILVLDYVKCENYISIVWLIYALTGLFYFNNMGLITTKPVFGEFEINKGADQHVQPSSLISALVIIYWKVS